MNKRLLLAVFGFFIVGITVAKENNPDSLEDVRLGEQLQHLQATLHANERKAESWWMTWTTLYSAATIGQGAVALIATDKSLRQDMIVGAGTTLLGVASQLMTPVSTSFCPLGADSVAKLSLTEKKRLLNQGEETLKRQAEIAQAGKSWQVHALSGTVNVASGLITWLGFKRSFGEGVLNFALNTLITETQIWTQPIGAKKAYERYLQANENGFEPSSTRSPEWYGQVSPASCSFGIRF